MSSDGSFDEEQEPPPKAEGLATAADSFREESVELVSDEHRDTQVRAVGGIVSSVCVIDEHSEYDVMFIVDTLLLCVHGSG